MGDSVFLITGASGGIGAATAMLALQRGYRLALGARDEARLNSLACQLGQPDRVLAARCDVTDWTQVTALVEQVRVSFGRLDVVFVNAGQFAEGPLLGGDRDDADAAAEQWRSMALTNVYGAAITARAVWPELVTTRGHLVFTGSVAGRVSIAGSFYSATKWAVTALAQSIRAAAVGTGVRVTVVQPGLVDAGPIPRERQGDPKLDPEDVARMVLFAVGQPPGVDVSEIVVRPTGQSAAR